MKKTNKWGVIHDKNDNVGTFMKYKTSLIDAVIGKWYVPKQGKKYEIFYCCSKN